MRNRRAFETIDEKLDRTRRQLAAGDARGTYRGAAPVDGGGAGSGDVTIINGDGGAEIHHVTLHATAGQTIAAGGAGIEWAAPAAGAPTEQRGFSSLTLPVVAIPVDVRGWVQWQLLDILLSQDIDGEFTVTQKRDGATVASETVNEKGGRGDVQWPWMYTEPKDTWTFTVDPDVTFDITRMKCDGFVIVEQTATSRPVLVETLWLDSRSSAAVASTATLEAGAAYTVRITGNAQLHSPASVDEGSPDDVLYVSSGQPASSKAEADAELIYAGTDPNSYPLHWSGIEFNPGSGWAHSEPSAGAATSVAAGHVYDFPVTGEGAVFSVRFVDSLYSDNNGQLKVEIFRGTA